MAEKRLDWRRDGLGILLFVVGVFSGVVTAKALLSGLGAEPSGTARLAALWLGTFGALPSLGLSLTLSGLGILVFLRGELRELPRHLVGAVLCTVAASFVLGALASGWGGAIGSATGGLLADRLHPTVGVVGGLLCLAAVLWFVWLRAVVDLPQESAAVAPVDEVEAATEAIADGVTAEESEALLPRGATAPAEVDLAELALEIAPRWQPHRAPPSPYPEDPRLRGEVPEGTRPLSGESGSAGAPGEDGAAIYGQEFGAAYRWRPAGEPAPAAQADPEDVAAEEARVLAGADEPAVEIEPFAGIEEEEDAIDPIELVQEDTTATVRAMPSAADEAPSALRVPPPAWEQSNLFEEAEDVPVDAYGTPLELVDELTGGADAEAEEADEELESAVFADAGDDEAAEGEEEDEEEEEDGEEDEEEEAFDLEEEDEEDAEEEEEVEAAAEDEVVLAPRAAPAARARKRPAAPASDADRGERLIEIGCLFIERGRVAVSLLQREYGMEFDEACGVLDELQERGLIGPYLGGQRRDILLTREEWLERAAAV